MQTRMVGQAFRFCVRYLVQLFMRCFRWVAAAIISFFSTSAATATTRSPSRPIPMTPRPIPARGSFSDPVIEAGVRYLLATIQIKTEGTNQEIFDDFLRQVDEVHYRALEMDAQLGQLIWKATVDYLSERMEDCRDILEMLLRAPALAA